MASSNITLELAEQAKTVERLEKLVAKRVEMLDRAYNELDRVQFKVSRREEILAEHREQLEAAQAVQEELEEKVREATAA